MIAWLRSTGRTAVATLCLLLALLSAASVSADALNEVQHGPGAPAEHQHMLLGNLTLIQDHHHGEDRDGRGDYVPGHQHYTDTGAALPAVEPADAAQPALARADPGPRVDHFVKGMPPGGAERPPKISDSLT